MNRLSALVFSALLTAGLFTTGAEAAGDTKHPEAIDWSFNGLFGTYDRDSLRRGYKVYTEVCASCHSMNQLRFRNLSQPGGPEFTALEVKAIAAGFTVEDGPDDYGDMFDRPGLPKDGFVNPFPNVQAARAANGGAYPPDLSLITKARSGGPDYIYALLTGYEDPPAGMKMRDGLYYNPYMAGGKIAMAAPLLEDLVEYTDGSAASVEQMSYDVVTFLNWAAEPELEERKQTGFMVLIYLTVFAGLLFFSMRRIWADKH